jgi:ATP-binding cassette, subfamily C, bacterial LapB
MKLVLKMYNKYTGNIYIDGVNVKDIDPDYIRQNITYVNQNSKLFDKIVFENMMYGCSDDETCKNNLDYILKKYKKINELFKNIDIYNKKAGSLGENLSGGQRQVVNIIGGLINPSKILLLDEPTNALDKDLKNDILALIADFKQHKKCIMIITHDKDVHSLFDQHIEM